LDGGVDQAVCLAPAIGAVGLHPGISEQPIDDEREIGGGSPIFFMLAGVQECSRHRPFPRRTSESLFCVSCGVREHGGGWVAVSVPWTSTLRDEHAHGHPDVAAPHRVGAAHRWMPAKPTRTSIIG
jgi:hypothetical protein